MLSTTTQSLRSRPRLSTTSRHCGFGLGAEGNGLGRLLASISQDDRLAVITTPLHLRARPVLNAARDLISVLRAGRLCPDVFAAIQQKRRRDSSTQKRGGSSNHTARWCNHSPGQERQCQSGKEEWNAHQAEDRQCAKRDK